MRVHVLYSEYLFTKHYFHYLKSCRCTLKAVCNIICFTHFSFITAIWVVFNLFPIYCFSLFGSNIRLSQFCFLVTVYFFLGVGLGFSVCISNSFNWPIGRSKFLLLFRHFVSLRRKQEHLCLVVSELCRDTFPICRRVPPFKVNIYTGTLVGPRLLQF